MNRFVNTIPALAFPPDRWERGTRPESHPRQFAIADGNETGLVMVEPQLKAAHLDERKRGRLGVQTQVLSSDGPHSAEIGQEFGTTASSEAAHGNSRKKRLGFKRLILYSAAWLRCASHRREGLGLRFQYPVCRHLTGVDLNKAVRCARVCRLGAWSARCVELRWRS